VEVPDFTPKQRQTSLAQIVLISLLTALLAGGLGGALGYLAAVRSGAGTSALGGGGASGLTNRAPDSLAGVVKNVLPSVVTVRAETSLGEAIGTGFIVSADGYVITNDHVVSGLSGTPSVRFSDSTTATAKLIGSDPESDIAVLKINKTGLKPITIGTSSGIAVGDPVLAVGAPLDLENSVTYGIISALHRPLEVSEGGQTRYYSAIQTDAAINHGNSGGPLVDASGRVIGVDAVIKSMTNDQEAGNIGLAFAIPIDQAKRVAEQIISNGKVPHTVMGVTVSNAGNSGGVKLATVSAGGPAQAAGMQPGDVVIAIGGGAVDQPGDLTALVREYAPGTVIPVVYQRSGSSHTVQVKLAADAG
jgi:putative serine protease PepD